MGHVRALLPDLRGRNGRPPKPLSTNLLAAATLALSTLAHAFQITPVPSPNLDLSQLGRVAVTGDFDSISLYQFVGQDENESRANGSQSLLAQLPNGAFASLAKADASILSMCPFVLNNGTFAGVVVGGNFTSLGNAEAQGIALFNPNTSVVTPMNGLSGKVNVVHCDQPSSTVYVGGSFTGANSTNAIMWNSGWTNMPFGGLNGPVTSITKAPSGNIVFGGSFTGFGNGANGSSTGPQQQDGQAVNIGSASVSAVGTSTQQGFNGPRSIICQTGQQDGPGNTWLLQDNTPGSWTAQFGFGFNPTRLRLHNTQQQGRGTRQWRFTGLPSNGIMNFTFTDAQGQLQSCSNQCTLPENNSTAQDFEFVNTVGMNGFRIDVSEWYGNGGGLSGIELFQNDIYSFAIQDFNEPSCAGSTSNANSTATGPWTTTAPPAASNSAYLTAALQGTPVDSSGDQVIFQPDITQSGNYSITVFTPGCIQDNTCSTRGRVRISGMPASRSGTAAPPISTDLFQTNNFDKFDQVYYGPIDADSSGFKPSVTLTPSPGQNGPITVVAERVRFELLSAASGLNGLFELNPNEQTNPQNFPSSVIDSAGNSFDTGASVTSLDVVGGTTFVGGDFLSQNASNVLSIGDSGSAPLPGGGLNAGVMTTFLNGSTLFFGGNFTSTADNKTTGLNGVAAFDTNANTWSPLGAGVSGAVLQIVPLMLNITPHQPEPVLTVSGFFNFVNAFGTIPQAPASNLAIWVPSRNNWLQNLGLTNIPDIQGELVTQIAVPGSTPLLAGSISSGLLGVSGSAQISTSGGLRLEPLGINMRPMSSPMSLATNTSSTPKRAVGSFRNQNVTGTVTGLFYDQSGLNITILGGQFTADGSNGAVINNLVLLDGSNNMVTGIGGNLDPTSAFLALGTQDTTLFAGGMVTGSVNNDNVNGLVLYDLSSKNFPASQPPALTGPLVVVNDIAPQPSSPSVYVGGSFNAAGSLSCPSLCIFDTSRQQWNSPGLGLSGSVAALTWVSNTRLMLAGNLTVGGSSTTMATYDSQGRNFTAFNGAASLPGPVTAMDSADDGYTTFWAAGTNTGNSSTFLQYYDGSKWNDVSSAIGTGSIIRGLQSMSVTKEHGSSPFVSRSQVLLVTGQLQLNGFGSASAALYNGSTMQPFILSNMANGEPGSLSGVFVQNTANLLKSLSKKPLAVGFVVLIALAIALGLVFLFCLLLLLVEKQRKKRQGYAPLGTGSDRDRAANIGRIPPEHLFGSVGPVGRSAKAPRI